MHTLSEFGQAPAVLSGVAKGSASEQSKLVRGELAILLVRRLSVIGAIQHLPQKWNDFAGGGSEDRTALVRAFLC